MFIYGAWSMVSQPMACLLLVIENWLYRAEQFRGLSVLAEDHSSVLSIHVGQLTTACNFSFVPCSGLWGYLIHVYRYINENEINIFFKNGFLVAICFLTMILALQSSKETFEKGASSRQYPGGGCSFLPWYPHCLGLSPSVQTKQQCIELSKKKHHLHKMKG